MAHPSATMTTLPTRLDRYPAKMISHLAEKLIERYAGNATHVLDPFCGSGAVLRAAAARKLRATGIDVNPFGVLLSGVKVEGFDKKRAQELLEDVLDLSQSGVLLPIAWEKKDYWYTPATLRKFEAIRWAASKRQLYRSKSGRAVLLSLGLAARLCSRADQRSPKPFISRTARAKRSGLHFDPGSVMRELLADLCVVHGGRRTVEGTVLTCDLGTCDKIVGLTDRCSHVITSPPYINAQDYFRNSKLELYLLESLLPFTVSNVRNRFIGSERGLDLAILDGDEAEERRRQVPQLKHLEKSRGDLAVVIHTYLDRMLSAFQVIKRSMCEDGTLVVVCGDNLIGGKRIVTWKVLNSMLERMGFKLFDTFEDKIRNRALAPVRSGHKGLIKQEVVSAFQRIR